MRKINTEKHQNFGVHNQNEKEKKNIRPRECECGCERELAEMVEMCDDNNDDGWQCVRVQIMEFYQ